MVLILQIALGILLAVVPLGGVWLWATSSNEVDVSVTSSVTALVIAAYIGLYLYLTWGV